MKRFLLIFLLSCISVSAEEVFLELKPQETHEYKIKNTKIEKMSIKKEDEEDYIYHPMEYVKQEFKDMYFNKKSDE